MKRLLDRDPYTGISTYHDYDELTDETTIATVADVEPILEENKVVQNTPGAFRGQTNEFWRVASIPNALIHKWLVEEGIDVFDKDHWPAVRRKLNSNEYRHLRTGGGRV